MATSPGGFLGKDLLEVRAKDITHDLKQTIKEKRQYPLGMRISHNYFFMRDLVTRKKDFMEDNHLYWQVKDFQGNIALLLKLEELYST
ncbi:MAG: hypothetical protein LBQ00_04380 [Syntrophobacterales bacterium]|jgi:hypothetical protein|nr:hypothetical protein [Syntrophobacterales bacterium]